MSPEVIAAIHKRIDELLFKLKERISSEQPTFDLLSKTIDTKDFYGLKNRVAEMMEFALRVYALASQIEALRNLPYDVTVEDPLTKKRPSIPPSPPDSFKRRQSGSLPVVALDNPPALITEKDPDPK